MLKTKKKVVVAKKRSITSIRNEQKCSKIQTDTSVEINALSNIFTNLLHLKSIEEICAVLYNGLTIIPDLQNINIDFVLFDKNVEKEKRFFYGHHSDSKKGFMPAKPGITIDSIQNFTNIVINSGKPLYLNDNYSQKSFKIDINQKRFKRTTIFIIPIKSIDNIFGYVSISKIGHNSINKSHTSLFEFAINLIAAALERYFSTKSQEDTIITNIENVERYRNIFEQTAIGIAHLDINGKFILVNQKYCEITGYTPEELYKKSFQEITMPEDLETDLNSFKSLLENKIKEYSREKRYIKKDDSFIWVNLTVYLVRDQWTNPKYLIAFAEDIHKRKESEEIIKSMNITLEERIQERTSALQATIKRLEEEIDIREQIEEALTRREEQFRQMAENILEVFWIRDANTRQMIYINQTYENIFGRTCESLYNDPESILRHTHPDDRDRVADAIVGQIRGINFNEKYRIIRPDGSIRWIWARSYPIKNSSGEITRLIGAALDITELKDVEEQILIERDKSQQYLDVAEVILLALNREGNIILINRKGCSVLEYSENEVLGKNWFDLCILPDDRSKMKTIFGEIFNSGLSDAEYHQNQVKTKSGRYRLIEWHNSFLKDNNGSLTGLLSSGIDITEQKQVEKSLQKREAQLAEALQIGRMAYWELDAKSNSILLNDQFYNLLETSFDEMGTYIINFEFYLKNFIYQEDINIITSEIDKIINQKDNYIFGKMEFRSISKKMNTQHSLIEYRIHFDQDHNLKKIYGIYQDITNRKIIENDLQKHKENLEELVHERTLELQNKEIKLRESEERYRILFEKSPDAILIADSITKHFDYVNPTACSLFDYSEEELLKLGLADIIPKENSIDLQLEFQKLVNGDQAPLFNVTCLRKDGSVLFVDINATTTTIDSKPYIVGVFRNVSERKKIEEALRISERKSRLLKEVAEAANAASTSEKALESAIESIGKYTKWTMGHVYFVTENNSKLISSKLWYFSDPDSYLIFKKVTESTNFDPGIGLPGRILKSKKPAWIEDICKDDNFIRKNVARDTGIFSAFAFPVLVDEEVVAALEFFSTMAEIPDRDLIELLGHIGIQLGYVIKRKTIEDDLRKLSLAVEQSPVSVVITSMEGKIEYVNSKFTTVTGYTAEETIGQNPRILNAGVQDKEFYKEMWNTILSGGEWRSEFCNRRKDGEVYWESASISPIRNIEGNLTHFVAVKEDITEKKLAAEELKKAKDAADAANRAKSEFLANMSHEIRTPMNAILGYAEILSKKISDLEYKDYLNTILSSGNTLLSLLNDILDLSKIEAGRLEINPEPTNINHLLNEIIHMFSQKIHEKGLTSRLLIDQSMPQTLYLDEVRVRQIILNLFSNAIKFTDQGSVGISATFYYNDEEKKDVRIIIKVEDTGIGIPSEEYDLIFEAFQQKSSQSTKKYGGTGLGLSIVKRLIEKMNGNIEVFSQSGIGSTFTVTLPNVKVLEQISNEYVPDESIFDIFFAPARILLVDDLEINRDLIKVYLEGMDLEIIEASSAEAALNYIQNKNIDLILMDMKLPGMSGIEAAKIIKTNEKTKHIPILSFTAASLKDIVNQDKGLFSGYLNKPLDRASLFNELMKFLSFRKIVSTQQNLTLTREDFKWENNPEKLKEFLLILENNFFKESENLQKTMSIDAIKLFGNNLKQLSSEYNCAYMKNYSNDLLEALEVLKVSKITYLLKIFKDIIEQIKRLST